MYYKCFLDCHGIRHSSSVIRNLSPRGASGPRANVICVGDGDHGEYLYCFHMLFKFNLCNSPYLSPRGLTTGPR